MSNLHPVFRGIADSFFLTPPPDSGSRADPHAAVVEPADSPMPVVESAQQVQQVQPERIMDRVLQIITAAPGLTVAQIAERAGVTGDQVSNALFKLHTRHGEAYRVSVPGARASVWFNTRCQADRFRDSRLPDKPQRAEASPGQHASMIDRILDIVIASPGLFVAQIAERAGVTADQCRNSLKRLATRRFKVYRADPAAGSAEGQWYPVGVLPARASTANGAALPTPPNRFDRMSGTYTGPNWAHSAGRPGAMDHLQHPSRRGDVLVPHTGQVVSMVGVGK